MRPAADGHIDTVLHFFQTVMLMKTQHLRSFGSGDILILHQELGFDPCQPANPCKVATQIADAVLIRATNGRPSASGGFAFLVCSTTQTQADTA